jgi:hypothetical protein
VGRVSRHCRIGSLPCCFPFPVQPSTIGDHLRLFFLHPSLPSLPFCKKFRCRPLSSVSRPAIRHFGLAIRRFVLKMLVHPMLIVCLPTDRRGSQGLGSTHNTALEQLPRRLLFRSYPSGPLLILGRFGAGTELETASHRPDAPRYEAGSHCLKYPKCTIQGSTEIQPGQFLFAGSSSILFCSYSPVIAGQAPVRGRGAPALGKQIVNSDPAFGWLRTSFQPECCWTSP